MFLKTERFLIRLLNKYRGEYSDCFEQKAGCMDMHVPCFGHKRFCERLTCVPLTSQVFSEEKTLKRKISETTKRRNQP